MTLGIAKIGGTLRIKLRAVMILDSVETRSVAVLPVRLSGEGEVVQAGDAEHGVMDAVAFESAVA